VTAVYFFAVILFVLLAAVLVAPLLDRQPRSRGVADPEERLGEALEALRELEFEHETGKIDDEDYRTLRAEYAAAAIAARDAGATVTAEAGDRRRSDEGSACGVCGAPTAPGAKFCSRCGTPVA
jgi:cytochrome c-type biogenesis protein CcmI